MHRSQVMLTHLHTSSVRWKTPASVPKTGTQHARAGGNERRFIRLLPFSPRTRRGREIVRRRFAILIRTHTRSIILLLHLASPLHYHHLLNHSPTPARR